MRFFWDLTADIITTSIGGLQHLTLPTVLKARQTKPIELQFHRSGVPERLPVGASILFGVKEPGKFDGDYLTSVSSWTRPESSGGFYTATISTNTDPIIEVLHLGDEPADDVAALPQCIGEFQYQLSGAPLPEKAPTIFVTLTAPVNQGGESIPDDADPPYPPADQVVTIADLVDPGVCYVRAPGDGGSDTTGDGSPGKPVATGNKAYDLGFRRIHFGRGSFQIQRTPTDNVILTLSGEGTAHTFLVIGLGGTYSHLITDLANESFFATEIGNDPGATLTLIGVRGDLLSTEGAAVFIERGGWNTIDVTDEGSLEMNQVAVYTSIDGQGSAGTPESEIGAEDAGDGMDGAALTMYYCRIFGPISLAHGASGGTGGTDGAAGILQAVHSVFPAPDEFTAGDLYSNNVIITL